MNNSIEQILKAHYVDGVYSTHVSMIEPTGKFQFNRNDIENLWEVYCNKLKNEEDLIVGIAEKSQQYMPVLVDIDIKITFDEKKLYKPKDHLYSKEQLKSVIQTYQNVLREILEGCTDEHLTCLVLEKKIYHIEKDGKKYTKNGFHLHFPRIFLNKDDQANHLIPRVKKIVKELNMFCNLGFADSSDIIDKGVLTAPWLLYGSRKQIDMEPYKLTKIFDCNLNAMKLVDAFINYKIFDNIERKINIRGKLMYYMPRILSILPYGRDNMELKNNLPLLNERSSKLEKKSFKTKEYTKNMEKDLELSAKLIHVLKIDRATEFLHWFKVGCALYNISEGTQDGYELFLEFSQRCSEKYDEDSCFETWDKMEIREEGLNIGSLRRWAKEDDPDAYQNICFDKNILQSLIDDAFSGSHAQTAQLFQFLYADNIRILNQNAVNMSFAHWDEEVSLWTIEPKAVFPNLVKTLIMPYVDKAITKLFNEMATLTDSKDNDQLKGKLNSELLHILSYKKSISNISFLEGVNRYYCGFPIDKNFESLLNAKPNELPIKNKKIIDLKTKLIRERTKDDLFSFELNIDYIQSCDYTNVIQFFNDICLRDEHLVDYMKRFFGYAMTGEILDRSLHIFWGNGKNGKSTIMDIFKRIIGKKFFVTTSERVMLKSTSTSATSPEVIRIKDARTIVLNETGKEEELNAERIKALTGGDEISARQLYSAQIEFNPKSTPIMLTNNKPKFDIHDQAMIDRIKLVPFLARFENNPENRDYINELMTDHIDEFFSWFADGAFEWYQGKSLIPCKVMQHEMQNYINELDIIGQFINERIEIVTKEKYSLTAKLDKSLLRIRKEVLYGLFIGFSEEQGVKVIGKTDFHKEILKINIDLIKSDGVWYYLCKEKKNTDNEE